MTTLEVADTKKTSISPSYWTEDLQSDCFVKAQLLTLSFSTGIQDAVSFPDFRCFASNQTGNTVLFAVAISGAGNGIFDPTNTSISLIAFVTGAFLAGQIGHLVGKRSRWWQSASQVVQACLVLLAAWMQWSKTAEYVYGGYLTLALLALSSGAQVGTARALAVPEITTAMATAAWVDLVVDVQLFSLRNQSRNRRILFIVALVLGSFVGAFIRQRVGSSSAVLISGLIKMLAVGGVLLASTTDQRHKLKDAESSTGSSVSIAVEE